MSTELTPVKSKDSVWCGSLNAARFQFLYNSRASGPASRPSSRSVTTVGSVSTVIMSMVELHTPLAEMFTFVAVSPGCERISEFREK
jgi:hypothetical protein